MKGLETRLLRELTAAAPATVRPVRPSSQQLRRPTLSLRPADDCAIAGVHAGEHAAVRAARSVAISCAVLTCHFTLSYAPFIGGAILAKTVFPQNQHVTKYDYHESGPSIVSRRL